MSSKLELSPYHSSLTKKLLDYFGAIFGLIAFSPLTFMISLLIKLRNHGPILFMQKRTGFRGKQFTLVKFRTMIQGAQKVQNNYKHLNISDGPTFKIPDDPRYTVFGKTLSKTGLDELPQLINVLKGEMSLIGPRPLPVREAKKLTKAQRVRESILPGITSSWVINGAHNLKFSKWMRLDRDYVENANLTTDLAILLKTVKLVLSIGKDKLLAFFLNSQ